MVIISPEFAWKETAHRCTVEEANLELGNPHLLEEIYRKTQDRLDFPLLGQFPCWPGRCGVCIGFEKDQDRYIVRLITGGVESDVALRRDSEGRWGIRHLVGPGKCVHSMSHTEWTNISPYAKSFLVSVKINIGAGLRWYSTKTRLQGSELQHLEAKASGRLGASAGAGNLRSCLLGHLASSQLASIVVVTVVHICTRKYRVNPPTGTPLSSWDLFFRTNRCLRSSPNVSGIKPWSIPQRDYLDRWMRLDAWHTMAITWL